MEAGLPSGMFTTADDALEAGKEVLVVPGSIHSKQYLNVTMGSGHFVTLVS